MAREDDFVLVHFRSFLATELCRSNSVLVLAASREMGARVSSAPEPGPIRGSLSLLAALTARCFSSTAVRSGLPYCHASTLPLTSLEKHTTFSNKMTTQRTAQPLEGQIKRRVYSAGRGSVFTATDFLDFGRRAVVDVALSRLAAQGVIRRLARGLYDYPKQHEAMGALHPTPEAIARALAARDAVRLQPAGAYAANLIGLSEQVPAKIVFLTDGPSRMVRVGKMEIRLRRTTPRNMATAGRTSGLLIQALRFLGKEHVGPAQTALLARRVPPAERRRLPKDLRYAPAWMRPIFLELAAAGS